MAKTLTFLQADQWFLTRFSTIVLLILSCFFLLSLNNCYSFKINSKLLQLPWKFYLIFPLLSFFDSFFLLQFFSPNMKMLGILKWTIWLHFRAFHILIQDDSCSIWMVLAVTCFLLTPVCKFSCFSPLFYLPIDNSLLDIM